MPERTRIAGLNVHKPHRAILISFDALKAIAHLGVIEGDLVKAQLMNLYHAKLEQTLIARGLFTLAKSLN